MPKPVSSDSNSEINKTDYFMKTKLHSAWLAMIGLVVLGCFLPSSGKAEDAPKKESRNQPLFIVLGEATNYVVDLKGEQFLFSCLQDLEPAGAWRSQSVALVRNGQKSSFRLGEADATNHMGPGLLVGDIICLGGKKPIDYNANPWAPPDNKGQAIRNDQTTTAGETNGVIVLLGRTENGIIDWNPDLKLYAVITRGGGTSGFDRSCTLLRNGEITRIRSSEMWSTNAPKLLPWDIVYVGRRVPFKF